jgi:RHS repeat-associated protein
LTYDAHKEIDKIEYNYLNLPEKITFTNDRVITFLYDATGRKLRKTVTNNGQTEQRDYLDGIEYKDGKPDQFLHSEGTVRRDENGAFHYYFVLRDHLGNTRVTFSDLNDDDKIDEYKEILQINHYYAYGLNMEGNWNGKDGTHKYQYNEKEWNDDFGLGWNDYNTRMYDPAMARFAGIDLLADDYAFQTPYAYAANNPIRYRDFMGMNPDDPNGVDGGTLKEVVVSAKRPEKKDPPISDDFRFQNLYDQLLGRINQIRENQMPQTLSALNAGQSVNNQADDDPQGSTTFEVSTALEVFNLNPYSNSLLEDDLMNARTIAQRLKHRLYKRIMEDITRPKFQPNNDENNLNEFNLFADAL